ncbi:MAG: VgrG-related protein [Dehalococcoidales bacterium]|nr:MAG: VgrG-related protein [Dehalococcoidales bacterium]
MPADELLSQMYLKINGTAASPEIMRDLRELVVDTSLHLPDMFTFHLDDPTLTWMDSSDFDIGKEVEISGKEEGASSSTTLITKGEITAIEPEMTEAGATTLIIRGYDKTHRLHRGKKTRTFLQATDSDIVKKVVSEAGLTAQTDTTSEVHEHVFQDFQTDIDFLRDRARRVGFYIYFQDGKLQFRQQPSAGDSIAILEWGVNLMNFQARLTTAEQVNDVEVHGWDVKNKQAIIGKSSTPRGTPTVDRVNHGGDTAKTAFGGSSTDVIHYSPVWTQGEADKFAQSILSDHCHAFFEAEGSCLGNPTVRAGAEVDIQKVGTRFSGRYRITRATHRYDLSGYSTEFEISGHRANTLNQLLDNPVKNPYGVVVGIVTNNNDPDGLARVKVKYPTISNDLESNWARLAVPMAGAERGFEFIPEVNDEVLVAFEYDDINKPYILGSLWNGNDKPPENNSNIVQNGTVQKRIIHSRSGHVITLDDSKGSEKIIIMDKTGNNSIEIDSSNNALTIKTDGPINMETKGDVTIKGNNINLEATANAKMKANSNVDLEANAKATVKGNTGVDVNASGPANIKGAVINLN